MTRLEQAIIETIIYLDVFEYPLTSFEIWKWLYGAHQPDQAGGEAYTLEEVSRVLDESATLSRFITSESGMIFLRGKASHREVRAERYVLAERKFRRAMRFARLIRLVPYIRMIAVCNSLGYSNARRGSDIDYFIVTASGRIWMARLLTVWMMKLFRLRPRRGHTADTLCFSFFVSEDHLDLSDACLHEVSCEAVDQDIYFIYWLAQMTPLYDEGGYYTRLWKANRKITSRLAQARQKFPSRRRSVATLKRLGAVKQLVERALNRMGGDSLERGARRVQQAIMPETLRRLSALNDRRVILNDRMLKLHYNDRRILYRAIWHEKIERIDQQASESRSASAV